MKCEKGLHFRHVEMLLLLFLLPMHTGVRKHILILRFFLEFFGVFFSKLFSLLQLNGYILMDFFFQKSRK